MDKNTITGLLLIGALLMGFMYCNRPDEEKNNAPVQQQTAQAPENNAKPLWADSTFNERVATAVRVYGTADTTATGVACHTLHIPDATISVSDSAGTRAYTGRVTLPDGTVEMDALMRNDSVMNAYARDAAIKIINSGIDNYSRYGTLSKHLGGEDKTLTLNRGNMSVTFNSRGGVIEKVVLNGYKTELTEKPEPICLFDGQTAQYNFEFQTASQRVATAPLNFKMEQVGDSTVMMTLDGADGAMMGVRYTIDQEHYLVKMDLVQNNVDKIIPGMKNTVTMRWVQKLQRNEVGRTFEERFSGIYYKMDNENPEDLDNYSDDNQKVNNGLIRWVAFKNQFFSSAIISKDAFTSADMNSVFLKEGNTLKDMSLEAQFKYDRNKADAAQFVFYLGPNDYPLLSDLDDTLTAYAPDNDKDLQLNKLVQVGWGIFGWINRFIVIPVFTFLSGFISNYGIIILLLTLFIKIILFPLTYKSYMSQAKMRVLAPEIKEINEKLPGKENAIKRQQETMKLYSKAGASPFSGCLPMLLQMPVLIAMFSFFPSAIELRGQSFLWVHDLSAPDYIFTLPFSIPFLGNKLSLFCLLMTAVNIIYTRINMQNQPTSSTMPAMKWMMYLMPVMFLFFFNDYAAGLSYYYFTSLLITIIQTYAFRYFINEKKVRAQMLENAKKPRKKSGFMARLEAAQKKQEALMREQARQNAKRRR